MPRPWACATFTGTPGHVVCRGLTGYLAAAQPGCWGLLTSTQLAGLGQEPDQVLYTDCRAVADWMAAAYRVRYPVSGLTNLLHRLGYRYQLTTAVSCQTDAAHPTHNTRAPHVWTQTGKEHPLRTAIKNI